MRDKPGGLCYLPSMDPETILAGTASLFLALADRTRLRLLNLMRDREVCVSSFTGVLGQSQPLVSRHLAYLRNSGLVDARREGKWIHYSISARLDDNTGRLLSELFKWMEQQDGLQVDRDRYLEISGEPALASSQLNSQASKKRVPREPKRVKPAAEEPEQVHPEVEPINDEPEASWQDVWEPEVEEYQQVRHNELEDFLL